MLWRSTDPKNISLIVYLYIKFQTPALIDKDEVRLHSTEKESPIQTYKMINALKLSSNKYRLRTEHFPTIHGELYYEYASSHEVNSQLKA